MLETIAPINENGLPENSLTENENDVDEIDSEEPAAEPVKPVQKPSTAKDTPKEILNNAFMLGWQIVELKSRIQIARVHSTDFGITQSSIWRSIVNKIAMMQVRAFPDSTTAETLYEPPEQDSLPYLYPPTPDYANVGIPKNGPDGSPILEDFKLYDVTRRAINCLTLLYINEQESLIPDVIKLNRRKLVKAILKAAQNTGQGGGDVEPTGDLSEPPNVVIDAELPEDATQFEIDLVTATDVLTKRTVKFLDAWDGYLRENYYAGGLIPRDDTELIAYEAGRSMSMLPWSISVLTVPLVSQKHDAAVPIAPLFIQAWTEVFRPQAIVRLQHQISSLSSQLDDFYYKKNPAVKRQEDDQVLVMPNADLPSQSIMAVKKSLDYWHRTVDWIAQLKDKSQIRHKDDSGIPEWSEPMRLALIEQANIWQTLMTGQQSLKAFNMESITRKLMDEVTTDIQKKLNTDFKGSFKQVKKEMSDLAIEVKDAVSTAGQTAVESLKDLYKTFKWVILGIVGVIVVVFIGLLILSLSGLNFKDILPGGVGVSGVISSILGYLGFNKINKEKKGKEEAITREHEGIKARVDAKTTGDGSTDSSASDPDFLSRIGSAANETGKLVLAAFQRGYKQIRIELSGLSHSAAVSYPLIEFFGLTFTFDSDDDFLTRIIWNGSQRDEQLKRVMSAAFGPLAVFITPLTNISDDKEGKGK